MNAPTAIAKKATTARQLAATLASVSRRLVMVVSTLERAGDVAVPSGAGKELLAIATAIRQSLEPAPSSAADTEKRASAADVWPRDMAVTHRPEPSWGQDPEGLAS